jgi:hypothetical protein
VKVKSRLLGYLLMTMRNNCFLDDGKKSIYTDWYMTDHDRNMRTLVVCFVLALAVLIPVRILQGDVGRRSEVLGETEVQKGDKMELLYKDEVDQKNEVVLPDAEVPVVVETEE